MPTKHAHSASIRPRPRTNGTTAYDVRYRHNGASRTLSFEHQKGAEKWASILRKVGPDEALAYLRLSTAAGAPTVDEYAEKYISTKSGIEPKTTNHYRMYMRLHISPTLGHLPIDSVTADMIAAWINAQENVSSKTIKNWHGFMSAMFQNAVDDGVIQRNPCNRSRLPESESTEMVFLSPNEFAQLISYIPPRSQPLVYLLAYTGLRWGEATALRSTDFDLEARTVRVSRAWKYSPANGWYIGPPKTKRSKRTVSISPELIVTLMPLLEPTREYVFASTTGKPVRQQNFYESVWAPARRLANGLSAFDKSKVNPDLPWTARAGGIWEGRKPSATPLGKWPRVHDLRHSHASLLLQEGVGIDVVSRRLGHESIVTTVDRYGHVSAERLHGAADAIARALSPAMPELSDHFTAELALSGKDHVGQDQT